MAEPASPRVVAIVQARLGSVRFPRKVLSPVLGRPVLDHLLIRLGRASTLDDVVLAIPDTPGDDELEALAAALGVTCYRGSEKDVLERYGAAAERANADVVVRVTGDCPLVAPELVDRVVSTLVAHRDGYVRTSEDFPHGFDVEAFGIEELRRAREMASADYEREHVTPYIKNDQRVKRTILEPDGVLPDARVTLDYREDLQVIAAVFDSFGHNNFTLRDVVDLMATQPSLFLANRHFRRYGGTSGDLGDQRA